MSKCLSGTQSLGAKASEIAQEATLQGRTGGNKDT